MIHINVINVIYTLEKNLQFFKNTITIRVVQISEDTTSTTFAIFVALLPLKCFDIYNADIQQKMNCYDTLVKNLAHVTGEKLYNFFFTYFN